MTKKKNNSISQVTDSLKNIKEESFSVLSWVSVGSHIVKAHFKVLQINSVQSRLTLKIEEAEANFFSDFIKGDGNLDFFCEKQGLFWSSELVETKSESEIIVTFPYFHKVVDRRAGPRLELTQLMAVRYLFNGDIKSRRCLDLSLGGCSIVVKAEERDFEPPHQVDQLQLEYSGIKKVLNVEVTGIEKLKPYQDPRYPYRIKKIHFKFVEMTSKQITALESFFVELKKIS